MSKPDFKKETDSLYSRDREPSRLEIMIKLKQMWEAGYQHCMNTHEFKYEEDISPFSHWDE